MPSPLLRLSQIGLSYGPRAILGPISLDLFPGEILALVGASGSGKSTLLKLMAGLLTPQTGQIHRDLLPGQTSLVFQHPALAPWRSALANVALGLELLGQDRKTARQAAQAALDQVGLSKAGALYPHQLSGGMAMRVSLARALVTRPRMLLLDEPFSALDYLTRRTLLSDLHHTWANTAPKDRPALVLVTHDLEEAVYFAQRLIVLNGPPATIAQTLELDLNLPRSVTYRESHGFRHQVEVALAHLVAPNSGQDPSLTLRPDR